LGYQKRSGRAGGSRFKACGLLSLAVAVIGYSCAPQQPRSDEIVVSGCRVNIKQVCEVFFDQPNAQLSPFHLDGQSMERAPEYIDVLLPSKLLILECGYDTRLRSVTYATLGRQRPLIDAQIEYIRKAGFCTDDPAKLRVAIEQGEKEFLSGQLAASLAARRSAKPGPSAQPTPANP